MSLTFALAPTDLSALESDALIIGVYSGEDGATLAPNHLSEDTAEGVSELLEILNVTGSADQLVRLPGVEDSEAGILVLIGLGAPGEDETERVDALRYAAGSAVRQLPDLEEVTFDLPVTTTRELEAVAFGATLGSFSEEGLKVKSADSLKPGVQTVLIATELEGDSAEEALERGLILGEATNGARTLVNVPPSHLYPETFAEVATELVEDLPEVSARVYDYDQLLEGGFGGIAGVGQGSVRKPALVVLEYRPEGAQHHVALVGKGITFDTGGNSLKPAASMTTMKCDMAGAASVLHAVLAIAELGLPVAVTGYLCLAENMPGGYALRPEDVLTMRDGRTVEVLNTDAEGRLVMADGIALASESQPDVIVDIATLTGAAMAALGLRTAALMGDSEIRTRVLDAGEAAGEDYWPLPLKSYLRASMNTPVADIANMGERYGSAMVAGLFLREFVGKNDQGERIPWAHLDIAGPAFNEKAPYGYTPKEGTGFGTATLVNFVASYAE